MVRHVVHDLTLATLLAVVFATLSLPVKTNRTFWAEDLRFWYAYIILGVLLSIYVIVVFLRAFRHLNECHAGHEEGRPHDR